MKSEEKMRCIMINLLSLWWPICWKCGDPQTICAAKSLMTVRYCFLIVENKIVNCELSSNNPYSLWAAALHLRTCEKLDHILLLFTPG